MTGGSIDLPLISEGPAGNITVRRTGTIRAGIGLALLDGIIGAAGGPKAGLLAKYQQARNMVFEVVDIVASKVELAELDQYLEDADVSPDSKYLAELLEADELYVISETLKSKRFKVEAKRSDDTSINLDLPEIQAMVGGSVTVSAQSGETAKLTYEGEVPLVFGFQAIRLLYDQGHYTAFESTALKLAMRGLEDSCSDGTKRLITEAPLARLRS
jgi:hypothetical protein